jgi:four helix bundle protein
VSEIRSYEDLIAWQKAYRLVLRVYKASATFPAEERFGLTSQMRRCAVSVPSNIAEGWGRQSTTDYERFLRIARGSAFELNTQLKLAIDLGFLLDGEDVLADVDEVQRLLVGLIRSLSRTNTTPNR